MSSEPVSPLPSDRIALVTGSSRGIGRAMALALAAEGAHIVAVARTQGALEDLDDAIQAVRPGAPPATLVPLDLADGSGIDRLGEALFRRFGRLDTFVGAAGMLGALTPLAHVSPKTWENVLAINLTANWRLLRSLDPLLRASRAGRVVFVTSGTNHASPRAYWGPYAVSKAGLNALAMTYAAETASTSAVKVMLLNPGPVATRMRASAMPGEDPRALPTPEAFAAKAVRFCSPDWAQTGVIYDFPTDSLQSPEAAKPASAV